MRLIDTSAWVEWLVGSSTGQQVEKILPSRETWLVPTIVQLELAKWLSRETDEDKTDQTIAFTQMCVVAPLTTSIALSAAELCRSHKLATADAIVYATALAHNAELITCDAHFKGLPNVRFLAKV
jgi:uncharacterized protein